MKQKAGTKQGTNIPVGIGMGMLSGIAIMLACTLILTWLLSTERITEESMRYGVLIIYILSAGIASGVAVRQIRQNILPVSVGICICYILVLLGINALFFDGIYEGVGVTTLTILGTGVAVALITIKHQGRNRNYRRK